MHEIKEWERVKTDVALLVTLIDRKKREIERREGQRKDGRGEKTRQEKGRDKTQENRAVERG